MNNRKRLEKLEKMEKPVNPRTPWVPPIVEFTAGHDEQDPLLRMEEIRTQAEAAGWRKRDGVFAVEVIKCQNTQQG